MWGWRSWSGFADPHERLPGYYIAVVCEACARGFAHHACVVPSVKQALSRWSGPDFLRRIMRLSSAQMRNKCASDIRRPGGRFSSRALGVAAVDSVIQSASRTVTGRDSRISAGNKTAA